MASVLDPCRGVRAKESTQLIMMPDDEYARYLDEVRRLPKKQQRKWKRHNEKTDGSTSTIRFDGQEFYTRWLNQRVVMKSQSMIAELQREHDARPGSITTVQLQNYQDDDVYHAGMDRMLVETHTGNHTARNHFVGVPTKPGEAVRG